MPPLPLLDFFLKARHIDSTTRMIIMNKPTTITINTHAFNPKTFVFFDNPEFRSDAILLLTNKFANIRVEKLEGTLITTTKSYDTKLLNQANLHKQSDQNN
jgi:hypothetical protein